MRLEAFFIEIVPSAGESMEHDHFQACYGSVVTEKDKIDSGSPIALIEVEFKF